MFLEVISAAMLALIISYFACAGQIRSGPVDLPNVARKAHKAPTPTSGGVGIAAGYAAAMIALSIFSQTVRYDMTSIGAGLFSTASVVAYAFLAIGFVDDAHPMGPRTKFVLFALCALVACYVLGPVRKFELGFGSEAYLPFWLGLLGSAAWVFTMVNFVNFMDGSNGLAMGSVAIALTGLGAIALIDGSPAAASMSFIGAGALIGFLFWNFPKARLFAGDSGALFAGALGALAAIIAVHRADLSPFAAAILFFPLLADALLTLIYRAGRRRSLLDGHAEHVYQIAHRAGWSHKRVAFAYWTAMVGCALTAFAVTRQPEGPAAWIALLILIVLAVAISGRVRSFALKRGIAEA